MCEPVTATAAVLAIGGAAVGTAAAVVKQQATNADYSAKSAAWTQNVINAETAARDDQTNILQHQLQEQGATDQKLQVSELEQAQKSSSAEVSAVAGGVAGNSVTNILNDIAAKSEDNRTYADENYKFIVADTQTRLTNTNDTLQQRVASVARPVAPSQAPMFLGIADSFLKAGTSLYGGKPGASTSSASSGD